MIIWRLWLRFFLSCRTKFGRRIIEWKIEGIRGDHLERDQQACWKYHRFLFEQRSVHFFRTWKVVVWDDLKREFWEHEMGCLKGSKERALRAWERAIVLDLCKEFFRGKDAIFFKGSRRNFSKLKGVIKKERKGGADYCCFQRSSQAREIVWKDRCKEIWE